jgi:1-phosphatidylinositol-4-phosphate 5-kinase
MIKTLKPGEAACLVKNLHKYYEYMTTKKTFIVPFLGLYHLSENITGRSEYLCVMKNLFATSHVIDEIFDLKGSKLDRVTPHDQRRPGVPLKDLDFGERVILLPNPQSSEALEQIKADGLFLARVMKTMDYSMLVGIHVTESEIDIESEPMSRDGGYHSMNRDRIYYFGIIDYLVEYDKKKQVETVVKTTIALSKEDVSSINPDLYAQRFITFLEERMSWKPN